ncbi:putative NADH-ubiquinone oxidoreductase 30.4 kDa subunit, mitochondrial [Stygiomarasmius scandens]|uniref:NADH-ubiquinone oxidoreductase 30.4 kDa subunit, mitochondrial n=1 Tax=Marasmiellus scandens TaxID=2682957 RepID=A0ABR1JSL5_9AGAR
MTNSPCTPPSGIIPVLTLLRDHSQCQFKSVMDISGVDFPEREKRFEVVYHLLSVKYRGRIRVKTYAGEGDHVPSAIEVFESVDWTSFEERLPSYGEPDFTYLYLRPTHPHGYTELRYDEERRRVVYELLKLVQAFRNFEFLSLGARPDNLKPLPPPKPEEQKK